MSFILAIALAAAPAQASSLKLECNFSEENPMGAEEEGPRPIVFTIEARGSRVASVAVEDPTGILSTGNVVGFFSTSRRGSTVVDAPRDDQPAWRGKIGSEWIELKANRRAISLMPHSQEPGGWEGRLRYELGGAGSVTFTRDGTLSCRAAKAGAAENTK
jgi:hypothetical protein